MTKMTTVRRSLLMSILSLVICFAMLLGTTFAWFTDSVTSSGNIIKTGKLAVELHYADANVAVADAAWKNADGVAIFAYENWEPGYTVAKHLKVSNKGTLDLKYQLAIVPEGEVSELAEVIDVYFVEGGAQIDERTDLTTENYRGTLAELIKTGIAKGNLYAEGSEKGAKDYVATVVLKMQESAGNEYQELKVGDSFSIKLFATQLTSESDSFDDQYDKGAALPWDGSVDVSWYDRDETSFELYTPEALAGFAAIVNGTAVSPVTTFATDSETLIKDSFSGKTVTLCADIDLAGKSWTPIGQTGALQFAGTFDGNGKTIRNLYVDNTEVTGEYGAAGLFGWVEQHSGANSIKNLTIDGVVIDSHRYSGAVAGWINIPVTDCTVKNVTINCTYYNDATDGTKVGALVGYADNKSNLTGNTVDTAVLTAYGDVGGLAGIAQKTVSVDGNTVKNVTITYTSGVKSVPGEVASTRITPVYGTNTVENVAIVKAITVSTDAELAAALSSTDKYVTINLAADVAWSYPARSAYAGADTASVVINGNGKTLTLKQTDSDWSSIGLANAEGVLTLNDVKVVKAAHAGNQAWNNHAVNFFCDVVMNDVTFDNSVALSGDSELNDVTITDAKGSYYGLIVTAKGQTVTVDGLNIVSGRAVKVMDQYVDAPEKVTIEISNAVFTTTSKAAVLVTNTAGADIVIGENVDLSGVAADITNAVWVDEDRAVSYDLVTVTGGTKILESSVKSVTNSEELAAAIKSGKTYIQMAAGTYQMTADAQGKTLTLTGVGTSAADVVIEVVPGGQGEAGGQLDYSFDGSTVTFNNLTIKTNSKLYAGYARLSGTYNNCVIQNTYNCGVGNSAFYNCTFNITNEYLRVSGAYSAIFEGCTFNTDGRAILVFQDGTSNAQTVTVKDCIFNATAAAQTWNGIHVAAVSIDGTSGTYVVNLEGANTVDSDFNGLWQIKAGEANVTVNE